jgi:hypothetical protein
LEAIAKLLMDLKFTLPVPEVVNQNPLAEKFFTLEQDDRLCDELFLLWQQLGTS